MKDSSRIRTWIGLAIIGVVTFFALSDFALLNFRPSTGVWIGLGVAFYFGVIRGGFGKGCCGRSACAPAGDTN